MIGLSLNSLKDYVQATKVFDEAIKVNPNIAEVYLNKGSLLLIIGLSLY